MKKTLTLLLLLWAQVVCANSTQETPLIVGVHHALPFATENPKDGTWHGLAVDLLSQALQALEKPYIFKNVDAADAANALKTGAIDIFISQKPYDPTEMKGMEMSLPYLVGGIGMAVMQRNGEFSLLQAILDNTFSLGFLYGLLSILSVIFGFSYLMWRLESGVDNTLFPKTFKKGIFAAMWWSIVTATTVGYGDIVPRSSRGRLLAAGWIFFCVLTISNIVAGLSSSLTTKHIGRLSVTANTLDRYRIGVVQGGVGERYLADNFMNYQNYDTFAAVFDALAKGDIDVVVGDAVVMQYIIQSQHRPVLMMPHTIGNLYYGFTWAPSFKDRQQVNATILNVINQDSWKKILFTYLGKFGVEIGSSAL